MSGREEGREGAMGGRMSQAVDDPGGRDRGAFGSSIAGGQSYLVPVVK